MDLDQLDLRAFDGRPVAVLGLARSGLALTRFLADQGADVTVYDARPLEELGEAVANLGDRRPRLALGPQVDPAEVLAGQALICTSPSVSSRFPTTEPRLRAALAAVEADGRTPVVSEVDLFLRLCPAATVGVTGTKGKTTTSSLVAAVLAAGDAPVMLGGNIGIPLIERLPQLTPAHRVVLELSELQLPTLSRGTDVAVYTHVTSDHLDRHGSLEAYRAVKHRLLELLPPAGILVRNDDDPVVSGYRAPAGRRTVTYARSSPAPDGVGVRDGQVVAGSQLLPGAGERPILPLADIPLPGEHSVSNVLAAVAVGLVYGIAPAGHRGASAFLRRRGAPPGAGRGGRRRALHQRLPGHPAGRRHRGGALVRAAARAHRRRARQGQPHRGAGARRGRACHGRRAHRRVGERAGGGIRGRRTGAHRARGVDGGGGQRSRLASHV